MAIVKMKKLKLMVASSEREELLRELMLLGCVQVSQPPSADEESENLLSPAEVPDMLKHRTEQNAFAASLAVLKKYHFLYEHKIEMDDEVQIVYNFCHAPAFVPFLIFARELINPPTTFFYHHGRRQKPYLN